MRIPRDCPLARLLCVVAFLLAVGDALRAAETNNLAKQELKPELVSFPGGDLTLQGFLYRPEGKGPFPSILWNHGSEKLPGDRSDLARFYIAKGFVFFVPHRHGHGRSPGNYIVDLQTRARSDFPNEIDYQKKVVQLHELYLKDTLAAATWLRAQPEMDTNRMIMSGCSYGGIQTLLAAEADAGMKGYAPFAPGAMSWAGNPQLRERLLTAVRKSHSPIFLLQAENDYNLGPSQLLGAELKRKGEPNRSKICPPFGETHQSGHGGFACRGTSVWGDDVLGFIAKAFSTQPEK